VFVASVAQVTSPGAKSLGPREEISPHRSEGFGRGMAEALQLGVDVIATAYGGNTDFCTGPLAHPVRGLPRLGGAGSGSCRRADAAGGSASTGFGQRSRGGCSGSQP